MQYQLYCVLISSVALRLTCVTYILACCTRKASLTTALLAFGSKNRVRMSADA